MLTLALLTVSVSVLEVLVLKLPSPPYTAVIECEPTPNAEVLNVACPPLRVPDPSVAAPSLKVTDPLGVPLPGALALTVAVKVTDWPDTEGLLDETTVVVVFAGLFVSFKALEVLVLKFALPP